MNFKFAKASNYKQVCHDLGFIPEIHFVKITTRGTISFYCGKPQDVRALY